MKIFTAALTLLALTSGAFAGETSIFSDGNEVYRMQYTVKLKVSKKFTDEESLELATKHSNYLVGAIAYTPQRENSNATGAPLRKKGDVTVTAVTATEITYAYDGETVLNREGLSEFTLNLPEKIEEMETQEESGIKACSLGGHADHIAVLPVYWAPFNKRCEIPYLTVKAKLSPIKMKTTYPDYPRLAKDGVIKIAILEGKMEESADHNPYGWSTNDPSRGEYQGIVKRLKKLGFVRTEYTQAKDEDESSVEILEATFGEGAGKVKIVVTMVYGNSVNSSLEGETGLKEFYNRYLELAKDNALVVYSGHAGFLVHPEGTHFYPGLKVDLNPDSYQIFVMNGCQTNDYIYPFFAIKDPKNMEIFVNARETVVNASAITVLLDAITLWADEGKWTSYPDIVSRVDRVGAMLGVVGEQDNPVAPHTLSK